MSSRPKRQGAGQKEKHYPNEPEPEKPEKKAAAKRTTTPRSPRSPRATTPRAAKEKKAPAAAPKRAPRKRRGKADSDDELPPWTKELKKSEETGAALAYIVLPVANPRDSAQVYKTLFGFSQRTDDKMADMWIELNTGGTALAFHKTDAKQVAAASGPASSWFVPDITEFHERAKKVEGVTVVEPPTKQPYWDGIKSQYTDLDGLPFSVVEWKEEKMKEMVALMKKKKAEEEAEAKAKAKSEAAAAGGDDDKAAAAGSESVDEEEDGDDSSKKKRSRPKAKGKAKSKKKSAPRKKAKKDEGENAGEHEGDDAAAGDATKKEEEPAGNAAEHSE